MCCCFWRQFNPDSDARSASGCPPRLWLRHFVLRQIYYIVYPFTEITVCTNIYAPAGATHRCFYGNRDSWALPHRSCRSKHVQLWTVSPVMSMLALQECSDTTDILTLSLHTVFSSSWQMMVHECVSLSCTKPFTTTMQLTPRCLNTGMRQQKLNWGCVTSPKVHRPPPPPVTLVGHRVSPSTLAKEITRQVSVSEAHEPASVAKFCCEELALQ